jgi:hypothetical protein
MEVQAPAFHVLRHLPQVDLVMASCKEHAGPAEVAARRHISRTIGKRTRIS